MRAKYLYIMFAAGVLASCSEGIEDATSYLGGSGKTPIAVQTNLSTAPQTRAYDKKFEKDDELLAYIEAGKTTDGVFSSEGNPFKGLQTLVLTAAADNTDGDNHADLYGYSVLPDGVHITETEDAGLQKLYWDNYSSTEHDLRDAGAGIRLKYGYCYNGGTPSTALVEATGVLGWTVNVDQSAAEGADMKKSDLLYAKTQAPVSYIPGTTQESNHGVLVLPYAHAMSKITINVTAGKGYDNTKANFATSVLTLNKMQTKVTVDAPNDTIEASSDNADLKDIVTYIAKKENMKATYQAIVAPCTNLSLGNVLASITNIDGNNYNIPVTAGMLEQWSTGSHLWSDEEVIENGTAQAKPMTRANIDAGTGFKTKPGVHYILDVTVNKQTITIRATIADWDEVKAEGVGEINFAGDVTEKGTIATELQAQGFDVYKSSTNIAFSTASTKVTYAAGKWGYSPAIYWAGQGDASYFRAVSPAGASASALTQGIDLMWGTSGDAAIAPRTGDVPLDFKHLMSKLCIKLETTTGDNAVKLAGATIKITNMAKTGSYSIVDGSVASGSVVETMLSGKPSGFTEYVVPQSIANGARLVITLADGTTYSLQLNKCTTADESEVNAWEKGKSYTYTIHLEKEKITFRALVKEWDEAKGSGNATLEWD